VQGDRAHRLRRGLASRCRVGGKENASGPGSLGSGHTGNCRPLNLLAQRLPGSWTISYIGPVAQGMVRVRTDGRESQQFSLRGSRFQSGEKGPRGESCSAQELPTALSQAGPVATLGQVVACSLSCIIKLL